MNDLTTSDRIHRMMEELAAAADAEREFFTGGDITRIYTARNHGISGVPQEFLPREAPKGRMGMFYKPSKNDVIAMDIAARRARGQRIVYVDSEAGFRPRPQFSSAALQLAMQDRTRGVTQD